MWRLQESTSRYPWNSELLIHAIPGIDRFVLSTTASSVGVRLSKAGMGVWGKGMASESPCPTPALERPTGVTFLSIREFFLFATGLSTPFPRRS